MAQPTGRGDRGLTGATNRPLRAGTGTPYQGIALDMDKGKP
jgi:hypothetical protein